MAGDKIGLTDVLKLLGAAPEILELVNDVRNAVREESDGGKAVTTTEFNEWIEDLKAIADKILGT